MREKTNLEKLKEKHVDDEAKFDIIEETEKAIKDDNEKEEKRAFKSLYANKTLKTKAKTFYGVHRKLSSYWSNETHLSQLILIQILKELQDKK